jgi:SpoVK/Ycf46/Vps4 family AAA+-type ATPase
MSQKVSKSDQLVAESIHPGKNLVVLARAAINGDNTTLRRALAELSRHYDGPDSDEVKRQLHQLTQQSVKQLRPLQDADRLPVDAKTRTPLLQPGDDPNAPLLMEDSVQEELDLILEEFSHAEQLSAKGLATRNTLLLYGPPGTGKSHIAHHLAQRLGRPLSIVRLDSVISSLLGDTAKNIRSLFDYADGTSSVLFLDELDALAKFRDDQKELGELKRVVNTLLQGLDNLEPTSIVIGATNHPDILDPAIWRRFTHSIEVCLPSSGLRASLWNLYLFEDSGDLRVCEALARCAKDLSASDIREIALAARRRSVVTNSPIDLPQIATAIIASVSGRIQRPKTKPLSTQERDALLFELAKREEVRQVDISHILSMKKQIVSKMLKAPDNNH